MTVQIYALVEGLDGLSWPFLKIFFQFILPLMIQFDYTQLPTGERRLLCHERILAVLHTGEWTAIEDIEIIWLKFYRHGRYPSRTRARLNKSLWFMEARHIIQVRVAPNTDNITHVRRVKHVPGLMPWRPRRILRAQGRPPRGE